MKVYLLVLLGFLLFPFLVWGAMDDVLLQSGTEITANSLTMTIQESGVESLTVNDGNFTVDLPTGSAVAITSANRATFTVSPSSRTESFTCGSASSVLVLKGPPNGASTETVTVTPSATTCNTGGGGVSSSGGGGGGGGGGSSVAVASAVKTVPASSVATPSAIAQAVSPVFTQKLTRGFSHSDVKRLQQLLNSDPDTKIAVSGAGSPGNESNSFGALTEAAVKKFQIKYGVVSSGSPETTGFGSVGPATRKKLIEVFAKVAPVAPSVAQPGAVATVVSPVFTSGLGFGASGTDVKRLQQLLNSDPDTKIAVSGAGSPGNEVEFFGSLTKQAVQKFQMKYGIAAFGDAGYGYVGPKTRAKLETVFVKKGN